MFERKGEITYEVGVDVPRSCSNGAIEAGAEDIESSEDGHLIYCAGGYYEVSIP